MTNSIKYRSSESQHISHLAVETLILAGGDLFTYQAYDRIHAMTVQKKTSIEAKDAGFRRENKQNKKLKAIYGVTTPQEEKQSSLVDTTVKIDKLGSLDDTTVLGSFSSLSTRVTTTNGGNRIDVVVPVESIRTISDRFGGSSYARVMIKLRADVELKNNIVVAMPRIKGEGHYTCNVRVEYEWKPPSGNKKKGVEPTIEASNSNPFDVLNSIDNDVEFGKLRLLDNDVNPLVPTGIVESDSKVEVMDSYLDNDDYDPYNDAMDENRSLSEHLQSICNDLDITVLDRKKK
uniref:Uncharacterized protein n=1 Tax=Tanacetum cinerariifolium TaxID=118510 RepID=A0A6L2NMH2_TANCI|nr:hypothetical protein [Tanacetum cinerariifolium]